MSNFFFVATGICLLLALLAIVPMLTTKRRWLAAIFVIVGVGCFTEGIYQRSTRDEVTTENIEQKVRKWLDAVNLGSEKVPDEHAYFNFAISGQGRTPLTVAREKARDRYVTVAARITLSEEDKKTYARLSEQQRTQFLLEVSSELAKAKTGYIFDPLSVTITVLRRIPITSDLSEYSFLEILDQVSSGFILVNNTIELGLMRLKSTPPSPTPDTATSPH